MEQESTMPFSRKVTPLVVLLFVAGFSFWLGFDRGQTVSGQSHIPEGIVGAVPSEKTFLGNRAGLNKNDEQVDFSLFWKSWDLLKEKYVEKEKLRAEQMMYGAIKGMLASTGDPYTTFFDPEENKEFQEEISGSFQGIGAEIGLKDGVVSVVAPLEDSPAQKAGVLAGDKILKIDGTSTLDMDLTKAVGLIRGEKGTDVTLTVFRNGEENQTKDIAVRRDIITVKSVKTQWKDSEIAVIKISRFGDEGNDETTDDAFKKALSESISRKSRGLILDLRNNPGGYLDAAVSISSLMLPRGKTVVIEENGDGDQKKLSARGGDMASGVETVVLVNEGSASASEILAGALRDNRDNVTLVGKKTFGKGSVQELLPVTKDTSVKITVAKWLTPSGKQINHEGISPDVEVSPTADDIKEDRDPQMEKALEILREKLR